ncbi:MAG: glycosyl transferase family 51, partial [Gammaproteobacteria bacterium]
MWRRLVLPCLRVTLGVLFLGTLLGGGFLAREEMRHATLHSRWVADFAKEITWDVRPGPATAPLQPDRGPWDERLGYAGLPAFSERLATAGYAITRQAEPSRRMTELAGLGFFNAYEEKSQAGLELRD